MDYMLPLIILTARIVETTLETIRTIYVSKGHKYQASAIGVVKIGIWLISTGLVLTNLSNILGILAYMAGYGIGTILGMEIEARIGIGNAIVRIFSPKDPDQLIARLGNLGFGITRINGAGRYTQDVTVLLLVIPRREESKLLGVLRREYPDLLFTIEDISTMSEREAYFGTRRRPNILRFFGA